MQASKAASSALRNPKTAPRAGLVKAIWERFQLYGFAGLSTAIALTLAFVLLIGLPVALHNKTASPVFPDKTQLNFAILVVHILTAIPPLALGMFAFSRRVRNASLRAHRWIGTTYCIAIWISAVTGVLLALANQHGIIAKLGFGGLGVGWFLTTYLAYKTGRAKDIVNHRRWMIRSYALTLAVVSIRPMFLMQPPFGLEAEAWYLIATWACWVPNLCLGELYIRVTKPNGKLKYAFG